MTINIFKGWVVAFEYENFVVGTKLKPVLVFSACCHRSRINCEMGGVILRPTFEVFHRNKTAKGISFFQRVPLWSRADDLTENATARFLRKTA